MGKSIEPAIAPLGFDWKIGIALITSFAAREVFVGTMATLYSVGDEDEGSLLLKEKMKAAVRPDGKPVFQPGLRLIPDDILCICHAVHEHIGCCKAGNKRMEMAHHPIAIYDRAGLPDEFNYLYYCEIVKRVYKTDLSPLCVKTTLTYLALVFY